MGTYRKKPIEVQAFRWTGDRDQTEDPEWAVDAIKKGIIYFKDAGTKLCKMCILTLEGIMTANRGDYIIQGIQGEIYPCKPSIFKETYEKVEKQMKEE